MAVITVIGDYVNDYLISRTGNSDAYLQEYLDSVEIEFLYKLLGKTLADAFISDAGANSGVPVDPLNLAIYNPIVLSKCYSENYSTGIKEMLKAFTFYRWFNRVPVQGTRTGQKVHVQTNSENANPNGIFNATKYNKAVANFKVIQAYIRENLDSYPDYEGQDLDFISPF